MDLEGDSDYSNEAISSENTEDIENDFIDTNITSDKINNKEKPINPKYSEYADYQGNLNNPKNPYIKEIIFQENENENNTKININLKYNESTNKLEKTQEDVEIENLAKNPKKLNTKDAKFIDTKYIELREENLCGDISKKSKNYLVFKIYCFWKTFLSNDT